MADGGSATIHSLGSSGTYLPVKEQFNNGISNF
jgi:hypothetical protein